MTDEEKIKIARREYHKKWRAKNKDKVRQYNQNFWLKQAEKAQKEVAENG